MEKIVNEHELSYSDLFKNVGVGNYLHVSLDAYQATAVMTECTKQNKYAGSNPLNNKYVTTRKLKEGYITIYQRW